LIRKLLFRSEITIALVLFFLMATFGTINHNFIRPANLAVMARGMSLLGIVTVGMALCMIGGMVDISVGSTAGLAGSIFAMSMTRWQLPLAVSLAAPFAVAVGFGVLNCTLILKGKMNPFIVTIATMFVARGLISYTTGGLTIYPMPEGFAALANSKPLGISWLFFIFVSLAIIAEIMLGTLWGLKLRAVGSNREIARCTEVETDRVTYTSFVIIGACAALAGILGVMRMNGAQPLLGQGWEFQALAACAIGGVSIFGYEGSLLGAFLGLATMQVLANGLVAIGMSPYLQMVAIGGALSLAMFLDARRKVRLDIVEVNQI
jgi:ribose transport system permease protein